MRAGFGLAVEEPGALEHTVHTQFFPRQFGRIPLRAHFDPVAVDDKEIPVDRNATRKLAVYRVVFGEMRIDFRIAKVVDRDDLDAVFFAALVVGTQDVAADAPVAVDCNPDGHERSPLKSRNFTSLRRLLPVMMRRGGELDCAERERLL